MNIRLTRHPYTATVCNRIHRPGGRGWWAGDGCDLFVVEFRLVSEVACRFFPPSLPCLRSLEINRTALAIYTDGWQCRCSVCVFTKSQRPCPMGMVGSARVRCACLLKPEAMPHGTSLLYNSVLVSTG